MKEIKIGRSNDNEIVIDDNSVSRNHAIIFVSENAIMIQDNNSTNGTFINGRRIQGSSPLQTNDILKVGNMPVPWRNYVGGNPSSNSNQSTRVTPNQNQYNAPVQGNGNQVNQQNYPTKKKSSVGMVIVISVVAIVLIAGAFYAFLFMKHNSNSSSREQQNPEVLKTLLIDQEQLYPLQYLTTDGNYKPTLFGNVKVNGIISNSATLATYKNVKLIFYFYSSTDRLISDREEYLDEYFPPNSRVTFKKKLDVPEGTHSIDWDIISAVPN